MRGRPPQRHRSQTRSRRKASRSTPSALINTERTIHASSARRLSTVRTRDRKLDPTIRYCNHLPSTVHAESVQSSYNSSSTSALAAVRKACLRTVQTALPAIAAVPIALIHHASWDAHKAAAATACAAHSAAAIRFERCRRTRKGPLIALAAYGASSGCLQRPIIGRSNNSADLIQ